MIAGSEISETFWELASIALIASTANVPSLLPARPASRLTVLFFYAESFQCLIGLGLHRFEAEFCFENGGFKPNNEDLYLLQRARFNMKIQPAWWLKVIAQAQDARVFYKAGTPAPPYQDTWNPRQAYTEIGDLEKGFFALRVGRQEINLGEERLVGSTN